MKKIRLPISEKDIRLLKAGDEILITGTMVTARDAAHKLLIEEKPDFPREVLNNGFIYHCGPIVRKTKFGWQFVAAGPTTSIREEPYQGTVIGEYNVRGVIGKGGMGEKTRIALKKHGAVYCLAIGGLAAILAKSIVRIREVWKLKEFGVPEAMWVIEATEFPAIVTMDASGKSYHDEILRLSQKNLAAM